MTTSAPGPDERVRRKRRAKLHEQLRAYLAEQRLREVIAKIKETDE